MRSGSGRASRQNSAVRPSALDAVVAIWHRQKRDIVSCEGDAAAPTLPSEGDILDMSAYDVHSQHDLPLPPVRVQRQRTSVRSLHRDLTDLR